MTEEVEHMIVLLENEIHKGSLRSSMTIAKRILDIFYSLAKSPLNEYEIADNIKKTIERLEYLSKFEIIIKNFCLKVNIIVDNLIKEQRRKNWITKYKSVGFIQLIPKLCEDDVPDNEKNFKDEIWGKLYDIETELNHVYDNIATYSHKYLHDGMVILTFGGSKCIEQGLIHPSMDKNLTVFVVERAPFYDGEAFAKKLMKKGLAATVISDSNVCAIMPRVSLVLLPTDGVLLDGSVITGCMSFNVALIAKYYKKPVIVLYWKWKLTEEFKPHTEQYYSISDPCPSFLEIKDNYHKNCVITLDHEVVPGELITCLINEDGPHHPADIYPQIQNLYHPTEDL